MLEYAQNQRKVKVEHFIYHSKKKGKIDAKTYIKRAGNTDD